MPSNLTSDLLHTFFDWRHKVMLRFFIGTAALGAATSFILEFPHLPDWLTIGIGIVGAAVSAAFWHMDRANTAMMRLAYKNGAAAERHMSLPNDVGLFVALRNRSNLLDGITRPASVTGTNDVQGVEDKEVASYRRVLAWLYLGSAGAFALSAIVQTVRFLR